MVNSTQNNHLLVGPTFIVQVRLSPKVSLHGQIRLHINIFSVTYITSLSNGSLVRYSRATVLLRTPSHCISSACVARFQDRSHFNGFAEHWGLCQDTKICHCCGKLRTSGWSGCGWVSCGVTSHLRRSR